MITDRHEQVVVRCKEIFAKAKELFALDLSEINILFDLKGRAAGMAVARGPFYQRKYSIRFNYDMLMRDAFNHIMNDTISHEISHICCMMNPALGKNHDSGWAQVCRQLGGSGDRYHQEEVIYGKGKTYEYVTTTGSKVRLSEQRHKSVQNGTIIIRYRNQSMGQVNINCLHTIVGHQGRTLASPIKLMPVNHSSEIEKALRTPAVTLKPIVRTRTTNTTGKVSKAEIARNIMLLNFLAGETYEKTITKIMEATGHTRNLARAYFKNNAAKLEIPAIYYS